MKKAKKEKKEKKVRAVEAQTCDDLYLKLFAARAARNVVARERNGLRALIAEKEALEVQKREAQRRALRFAGKLLLLFLLSFGSTISAVGCIRHGIWWASIAPFVLLLITILSVRRLPE